MSTPDNSHPGLFPQISVDGKDLKDPKQIANAFNNFFVNAANTVNKDIPLTFKSPNDYLKNTNPQSLFLYPVTKLENDKITEKHYKKFRNCVVYQIRKSKSEYFKNYFDKHKTSMKKIWSGIRKIVNTRQFSSRFISPNFSRW